MNRNVSEYKVMVSICCLAYNHEKFIRQTLDGFLMQKISFPFEIVIHDDASTDNTADIIREYETNYPNLFNALYQTENQRSKYKSGMNPRFNYPRAKGKYIALCEGDDYWTDPYKLQKQILFLEANPDFNICFTRANTLRGNIKEPYPIPDISPKGIYKYDDLLEHYNFITTASVVFRKNFNEIPNWYKKIPFGDLIIYFICCKNEKIKCLPDFTSIYRIHEGGVWSSTDKNTQYFNILKFYSKIFRVLTTKQKEIVKRKANNLIASISYQKYKNNRLLRVFYRTRLKTKYKLSI